MVEVLGQCVELEIFRDASHAPGLGLGFECAQHHLARIGLVVGTFVRHADDRHAFQAVDRFGQKVEMLASMQGQRDARSCRQIAAPHAAAIHHMLRLDVTGCAVLLHIVDASHPLAVVVNPGDLCTLDDLRPVHPGALGQSHRDIRRIALPVARQVHRRDRILDREPGAEFARLFRRDLVNLDAKGTGKSGLPQDFLMPVLGQCDGHRTGDFHPRRHTGLGLKVAVEFGGVLRQTRHVLVGPELTDQTGGVPGRAAGQPLPLQKHDILPAALCQMISDRTARDAATDDDHAGFVGQRHG